MMLRSPDMTEPVIEIRDLQYRYRGQKDNVLQDISLDVRKGEFVTVMGPSEAGKSEDWPLHRCWRCGRASRSWTNRPPTSTRSARSASSKFLSGCASATILRYWSSNTRPRRSSRPTGSFC